MANLFPNIANFKKYVGGAVNASLSISSIEAAMHEAAMTHIVPHIGRALWGKINGEDNLPLPANDPLWDYIKRPLARLTLYEYLADGSVMLSDVGLLEAQTEMQQTASIAAQNQYRASQLMKGYNGIEELLIYLMSNRGSYPTWALSEGFARHTELFLRYAGQMKLHYGADTNRFSYEVLRSIIRDVEYFAIEGWLSKQFVAHLRDVNETSNATAYEREVIVMIQAAITHFAVEEGIRRNWVRVAEGSILHIEGWRQAKMQQDIQVMKLKMSHHDLTANRHISRLKAYLWENKAEFPTLFHTSEGGTNNNADAWRVEMITERSEEDKKKDLVFHL